VLGRHEISIASVIQKARHAGTTVPLVLRTHRARGRNLERALAAIAKLDGVRAAPVAIRIEERLA
jgi:homoserine dehydrogenase